MSVISLPCYSSSSSKFLYSIELEGTMYTLHFSWSERESYWYMDIYDETDETLILGHIKLVPEYLLLTQYRATDGLPEGDFIYHDVTEDLTTEDLSYEAWGDRYVLLYAESTEVTS